MLFKELNDVAQADWFMLDMQPMSLKPCIYRAGSIHLRFLQRALESSEALHLPQLHLYRSATVILYAIVQQQYVLYTLSTVTPYALAVAGSCTYLQKQQ